MEDPGTVFLLDNLLLNHSYWLHVVFGLEIFELLFKVEKVLQVLILAKYPQSPALIAIVCEVRVLLDDGIPDGLLVQLLGALRVGTQARLILYFYIVLVAVELFDEANVLAPVLILS